MRNQKQTVTDAPEERNAENKDEKSADEGHQAPEEERFAPINSLSFPLLIGDLENGMSNAEDSTETTGQSVKEIELLCGLPNGPFLSGLTIA